RHTRFSRDWSSDVCSSDLATVAIDGAAPVDQQGLALGDLGFAGDSVRQRTVGLSRDDRAEGRLFGPTRFHFVFESGTDFEFGLSDRKSTRLNSSHVKISYA